MKRKYEDSFKLWLDTHDSKYLSDCCRRRELYCHEFAHLIAIIRAYPGERSSKAREDFLEKLREKFNKSINDAQNLKAIPLVLMENSSDSPSVFDKNHFRYDGDSLNYFNLYQELMLPYDRIGHAITMILEKHENANKPHLPITFDELTEETLVAKSFFVMFPEKLTELQRILNYSVSAEKAINKKVNELLHNYDDPAKDPAIDPSVNIMEIARACGIKEILYVPPGQLEGKYAIYKDGVVKIDENHTAGQRLFDLAHVVGRLVFNQVTMYTEFKLSRQGIRKKIELPPGEREFKDFFDRFAANLLVPISRFQLWEDRTDREIAKAFMVEEKCIKKRRREVAREIRVLTEVMKPCPIDDITDPDVQLDVEAILEEINS